MLEPVPKVWTDHLVTLPAKKKWIFISNLYILWIIFPQATQKLRHKPKKAIQKNCKNWFWGHLRSSFSNLIHYPKTTLFLSMKFILVCWPLPVIMIPVWPFDGFRSWYSGSFSEGNDKKTNGTGFSRYSETSSFRYSSTISSKSSDFRVS